MQELYETTSLDDLIPLVALQFPKMNKGVLKYNIREAAIQFARESKAIRRVIKIDTQKNVCDYILDIPDGYKIYEISNLDVNGCCLEKIRKCECCSGNNYFYFNKKITLCEAPECNGEITVCASVVPSRESCDIDAETIDLWGDVIADLAMSRMMNVPDTRWRNLTEGRFRKQEYRRGLEEARKHVQRQGVSDKVIHIGEFPKSGLGYGRYVN